MNPNLEGFTQFNHDAVSQARKLVAELKQECLANQRCKKPWLPISAAELYYLLASLLNELDSTHE